MKVAVVTGSSRGIGKTIAERLSVSGYDVIGISRTSKTSVDVRSQTQVQQFMKSIDRIDVLVNNAGYAHPAVPLQRIKYSDLFKSFTTNVFGPFYMMKEAIPIMKKQHSGVIINMASMAALYPSANLSVYSASKAALTAMTSAMSKELEDDILCVTICPGATNTKMRASSHGMKDAMKQQRPEIIANVVNEIVEKRTADGWPVRQGTCITIYRGKISFVK